MAAKITIQRKLRSELCNIYPRADDAARLFEQAAAPSRKKPAKRNFCWVRRCLAPKSDFQKGRCLYRAKTMGYSAFNVSWSASNDITWIRTGRRLHSRIHDLKLQLRLVALHSLEHLIRTFSMNKALVVVPTYNERDNLPSLAQRLLNLSRPVDILVVDDNSPDGTGELADEFAEKHPQFHVLHRPQKAGLGRAYIIGFMWAIEHGYDFVIEMDADFSHNPDDVPRLIEAVEQSADCAIGSRYVSGSRIINWPRSRLMLSKCAAIYVFCITGMRIADPTGGFKCFTRRALKAANLNELQSNGYSFQIEMNHRLWRQGYKIVEVPIIFTERAQGHSKMSKHIIWEALLMVWKLWFQNGLRRSPRI